VKAVALAFVLLLVVLAAAVATVPLAPGARAASSGAGPAASTTSNPVTGNVTGPSYLATSSNGTFRFNASGGPGVVGGQIIGKLTWTASLTGPNTTGTSVTPSNGTITSISSEPVVLSVKTGLRTGLFTLSVSVTSSLQKTNATGTISKGFHVLVPYTLRATLVTGPGASVLPFKVTVALDGAVVGTVTVPKIGPNTSYQFSYRYAIPDLASGYHTFTLTIANAHGLVTFSNGRTVETTTFYVAPAATSYTLYYVLGVVTFLGVLFIYATRVGARRRGATRR